MYTIRHHCMMWMVWSWQHQILCHAVVGQNQILCHAVKTSLSCKRRGDTVEKRPFHWCVQMLGKAKAQDACEGWVCDAVGPEAPIGFVDGVGAVGPLGVVVVEEGRAGRGMKGAGGSFTLTRVIWNTRVGWRQAKQDGVIECFDGLSHGLCSHKPG